MNSYPAKTRYRGEVAENYLKRRAGGARWTHEQRVIERLIDSFPSGSSILDVPLGTGRFVDHYFRRGLTVYGLDISRDMLREVRTGRSGEALPEGMVHADTECIPLRDNSVDYVVCARLLNWAPMSAFKVIISEFQRVARKGVLVEVRVARALRPLELIRSFGVDLATNPRGLASSILRITRAAVISRLRVAKRTIFRKASAPDGADSGGYIVHDIEDVLRVYAAEGMEIEDCAVVDHRKSYLRRVHQPFIVYLLSPGAKLEKTGKRRGQDG